MIDFTPIQTGSIKMADFQTQFTHADLIAGTQAMVDKMLSLIADARDEYVTFVPADPTAHDKDAATPEEASMAWTLGHVIVHVTASAEEAAAIGATLARGVEVAWRNRYEVPWQSVTTVAQLRHRLEESRRIRLAYLSAWPDAPHLEVFRQRNDQSKGVINAIGSTLNGLKHDADHLAQIEEIMRQARLSSQFLHHQQGG